MALTTLIEDAFAQEGAVGVASEAGTGTGKSYAYLLPAVLSGRKTLVTTTNKVLQGQIVDKDLPDLQKILASEGIAFTYVLSKGRGNYECKLRSSQLDADEKLGVLAFDKPETFQEWERFKGWRATTAEGDVEEINPLLSPELKAAVTVSGRTAWASPAPSSTPAG